LCPFEVDDFSKGGLSLTISAPVNDSNRVIRFESVLGICYEASLDDPNQPNVFKIIKITETTPTPTPTPSPTPEITPTPTPPIDCCADFTESSGVVAGQLADKNGVSGSANVDGNLCWMKFVGTALPQSYLCPFEVADFSKGGMSLTISAPITNETNLFRYETLDGACYEVRLTSTTEPNIFVKIAQKDSTPTPTPTPTPTATSTQTPAPAECCDGLTESSDIVANGSPADKNGITASGSHTGKLCWNTTSGTSLPSQYLCPFETDDFSQGGLSITLGANLTDTLFRFEASDGTCYETNLTNTSANGVNIFVKIN
jgi:hypothetical protein